MILSDVFAVFSTRGARYPETELAEDMFYLSNQLHIFWQKLNYYSLDAVEILKSSVYG